MPRVLNELQAPANVRLVIIHYYPQDSTLEMLESKETACPGIGRSLSLRRPARVSLEDIRVGSSVLVSVDLSNSVVFRHASFRAMYRRASPHVYPPPSRSECRRIHECSPTTSRTKPLTK